MELLLGQNLIGQENFLEDLGRMNAPFHHFEGGGNLLSVKQFIGPQNFLLERDSEGRGVFVKLLQQIDGLTILDNILPLLHWFGKDSKFRHRMLELSDQSGLARANVSFNHYGINGGHFRLSPGSKFSLQRMENFNTARGNARALDGGFLPQRLGDYEMSVLPPTETRDGSSTEAENAVLLENVSALAGSDDDSTSTVAGENSNP